MKLYRALLCMDCDEVFEAGENGSTQCPVCCNRFCYHIVKFQWATYEREAILRLLKKREGENNVPVS